MMRIIWLTICCILVGMTNAQARDSGFNPFGFMDDMFDSDSRRDRHRHRPPPPPPPFGGYRRPVAPHPAAPATRPQGQYQQPAQTARPSWGYPAYQQQPVRPVAPPEQASRSLSPPAPAAEPTPAAQPAPPRSQRRAIPNEKPVISRDSDDSILINGRPAVFRPMGLGSENGSQ